MINQIKIGAFLKELRKEKDLTQEQLAEKFAVSSRSVSRWENGNTMPELSILVELADYYEVDIKELIDGERKSENMNEEMKDTLQKIADYTENQKMKLEFKSMLIGMITMCVAFIVFIIISMCKGVSFLLLTSMLCAYNGATVISRAKYGKDKTYLIVGIMFFIAMILNTIAFILQ